MLRRIITWAIVIFIVYYLVTDPSGAAAIVHTLFDAIKDVGASLSRFVSDL